MERLMKGFHLISVHISCFFDSVLKLSNSGLSLFQTIHHFLFNPLHIFFLSFHQFFPFLQYSFELIFVIFEGSQ